MLKYVLLVKTTITNIHPITITYNYLIKLKPDLSYMYDNVIVHIIINNMITTHSRCVELQYTI